jgi:hypothetical protein
MKCRGWKGVDSSTFKGDAIGYQTAKYGVSIRVSITQKWG